MLSIQITHTKHFMQRLLTTDLFDHFLLIDAVVKTNVSYTISGKLEKDYYPGDSLELQGLQDALYLPFSKLRSVFLQLIKGPHTPLSFRLTLALSPENQANTLKRSYSGFSNDDVEGMYLNISFQNNTLICSSAISYRTFTINKQLDQEWRNFLSLFFKQQKIEFVQI